LQREPEVLIKPYQQAEVPLSLEDFREGMPFYTFPYIGVGGTLKKVFRRRAVKNTVAVTAAAHEKPPARLKDQTLDHWTVRYDEARRLHLYGNFQHARALYEQLLAQELPSELREEAMFFNAFTFYDEHRYAEAIKSWGQLIQAKPDSLWVPSA